ncbi:MAG: hypothetical protein LUF27_02120 [Lachnospiraceae bacterium]|nr:hypothetical protein [Lachnospiraceae bacterium]
MSIMDALFDGRIYPGEQVLSKDPKYAKTDREMDLLMSKLEDRLSKEDYDLVEEMCDLLSVSQDIQNKEFFRYGLSMGLQLMREAYEYELPGLQKAAKSENL